MLRDRDSRRLSQGTVRETNRRRSPLLPLQLNRIVRQRRSRAKLRNQVVRLLKNQRQPKLRSRVVLRQIGLRQKSLRQRRHRNRKRIVPRKLRRIRQRLNRRPNRTVRQRKNRLNRQRIRLLPQNRRRLQRSPRRRRRKRSGRKKRRSRRAFNCPGELSEHPEFSQGAFLWERVRAGFVD